MNVYRTGVQYAPLRPAAAPRKGLFSKRFKNRVRLVLVLGLALTIGGRVAWSSHAAAEAASLKQVQAEQHSLAEHREALFASQMNALFAANSQITFGIATDSDELGLETFGQTDQFDAASTGKLITAADYLRHIEHGTATLTQQIDGQSAQQLLEAMIVQSDDTAWSDLNDYLSHDDLASFAQSVGLHDYTPDDNTVAPGDIASLLAQLQNRTLLNAADRSLLLGYMKQANFREYIVPAVPASDTVYHKVGLDNDEVNDVAIITKGSGSFELSIYTNGNGTYDWDTRAQLIQTITKDAEQAYLP